MSLTNVTLTSQAVPPAVLFQPTPPVFSSAVPWRHPLPPPRVDEKNRMPVKLRHHGNRLGRRSLNMGSGHSPRSLVLAKGGVKRISVNDNGLVYTTTEPDSVNSMMRVLLLCHVAADLGFEFPPCMERETFKQANQSILSTVLLSFSHSQRYLCINRTGSVFSLQMNNTELANNLSECIFHHEIVSAQYDTFCSQQYPSNRRPNQKWYLGIRRHTVTSRKTTKSRPHPPKTAMFIKKHLTSHDSSQSHHAEGPQTQIRWSETTPFPMVSKGKNLGTNTTKKSGRRNRSTLKTPLSSQSYQTTDGQTLTVRSEITPNPLVQRSNGKRQRTKRPRKHHKGARKPPLSIHPKAKQDRRGGCSSKNLLSRCDEQKAYRVE